MANDTPIYLVHTDNNNAGFAVAHVANEIHSYEEFIETVSKDKRIPANYDTSRIWLPRMEHLSDKKLGIAKNSIYTHNDGKKVAPMKMQDWAFQGRDKNTKTLISGLYRQHRPMMSLGGDYKVFSESPFVIVAVGFDTNSQNLEKSVSTFFDSTGLTPKGLSEKDVADFEDKKGYVLGTIQDAKDNLGTKDIRKLNANLGYELLQGNHLYDRFVHLGDLGL